jgi:hypothetical protein
MLDLSFPVDPNTFNPDWSEWSQVVPTLIGGADSAIYTLNGMDQGPFPFKFKVFGGPRWNARLTLFNPSRALEPDATSLCDPALLAHVAGTFVMWLGHWAGPFLPTGKTLADISPAEFAAGLTINRLDVTRDFMTEDTARWRTHLATLKVPYWKTNTHDIKDGVPGTVTMGTKDQVIKLYDKHLESRGKAPVGTLRIETETRTRVLRQAGISTIDTATPDAIDRLYLTAWDRSGYGNPITAGRTYDAIAKLPDSPANKLTLLGVLQAAADGQPNGLSAKSMTKYNRLAAKAGISVGEPVRATGGVTRQLDIYAGREIVTIDLSAPV